MWIAYDYPSLYRINMTKGFFLIEAANFVKTKICAILKTFGYDCRQKRL